MGAQNSIQSLHTMPIKMLNSMAFIHSIVWLYRIILRISGKRKNSNQSASRLISDIQILKRIIVSVHRIGMIFSKMILIMKMMRVENRKRKNRKRKKYHPVHINPNQVRADLKLKRWQCGANIKKKNLKKQNFKIHQESLKLEFGDQKDFRTESHLLKQSVPKNTRRLCHVYPYQTSFVVH